MPKLSTAIDQSPAVDETAEKILQATRDLLLEFGLRRTSMDDIARRAGVGRATVFRKFADRSTLLGALFARETKRTIEAVDSIARQVEDPRQRVAAGFAALVETLSQHDLFNRLIKTDADQVIPVITTQSTQALQLGSAYIESQIEVFEQNSGMSCRNKPEVAEFLARFVISLTIASETVLPVDDRTKLHEFALDHIVPLIEGSSS